MRLRLAAVFAALPLSSALLASVHRRRCTPLSAADVAVYDGVFENEVCEALESAAASVEHTVFDRSEQSGTMLEAALDSVLNSLGDEGRYVEYWSRSDWKHIEAHADVDEGQAANGALRFPNFAHVLYAAVGSRVKGPTCVFEKGAVTTVPPVAGRILRFRGDLVHAVPRPFDVWLRPFTTAEKSTPEHKRCVVLFNSWDEPPRDVPTAKEYSIPFEYSVLLPKPRADWQSTPAEDNAADAAEVAVTLPLLGDRLRRSQEARTKPQLSTAKLVDALRERETVFKTPFWDP
ncbi:hypothetical protein M885DRAFT_541629 [Pelagophyceae sp. CCMP2097]|nr:hypothetical protein M885DRAFT_541629 [Pelagophyceae sp. CCMP2097]